MNDDFICNSQQDQDHPMIYYLLPEVVKRRCLALKKISLEQEALDRKYKKKRRQVWRRAETQADLSCPFGANHFELIAKKAADLKRLASSRSADDIASLSMETHRSNALRELLINCESKCHELMTHIANIDWELFEFEELLAGYHNEIEQVMTEYNTELGALYKRRLRILRGEHEPSDEELLLPESAANSSPEPKYLEGERQIERLYSLKYTAETERLLDERIGGVPDFWLQSLTIALHSVGVVEPVDRLPLKYLADVCYYYDTERDSPDSRLDSDLRTQLLLFFFDENPYFSNRVLSKTIYIDKSRKSGTEMFDGVWLLKKQGCTINWFKGKDLTRLIDCDQPDDNDVTDDEPLPSFFNFFSEKGFPSEEKVARRSSNGFEFRVELDYDVFARFRDFIAPHAIVAYSRGNLYQMECDKPESESYSKKRYYIDSLFD